MNIMSKLLAGFLALFLSFSVMADRHAEEHEEGAYLGLAISSAQLTADGNSIKPLNVNGRLGYDFNPYIGIGIDAGFTIMEDDNNTHGIEDAGIDTLFGYLKLGVPLKGKSKIYALVGPANVDGQASVNGTAGSVSDDDIAYGVGFQKYLDGFGFYVEYIQYYDEDNVTVNNTNIGNIKVRGAVLGLIGYF